MGKATVGIVAAISAASAEDLAEIRQQIAEATDQLNLLRTAEKLLAAKLEPAESVSRGQLKAGTDELRTKIEDWLRSHGPATSEEIGTALGITPRLAGLVCSKSKWFCRADSKRWKIAAG